eukprot:5216649-Prymnesium_polylepis.2
MPSQRRAQLRVSLRPKSRQYRMIVTGAICVCFASQLKCRCRRRGDIMAPHLDCSSQWPRMPKFCCGTSTHHGPQASRPHCTHIQMALGTERPQSDWCLHAAQPAG